MIKELKTFISYHGAIIFIHLDHIFTGRIEYGGLPGVHPVGLYILHHCIDLYFFIKPIDSVYFISEFAGTKELIAAKQHKQLGMCTVRSSDKLSIVKYTFLIGAIDESAKAKAILAVCCKDYKKA